MAQHDIPQSTDKVAAQPPKEASPHLQSDAGFGNVGDRSGNQAWAKMTGSNISSGEGSKGQNLGSDGKGLNSDHIDFAKAANIYASPEAAGGGQPGAHGVGSGGAAADRASAAGGASGDRTNTAGMASGIASDQTAPPGATDSPASLGARAGAHTPGDMKGASAHTASGAQTPGDMGGAGAPSAADAHASGDMRGAGTHPGAGAPSAAADGTDYQASGGAPTFDGSGHQITATGGQMYDAGGQPYTASHEASGGAPTFDGSGHQITATGGQMYDAGGQPYTASHEASAGAPTFDGGGHQITATGGQMYDAGGQPYTASHGASADAPAFDAGGRQISSAGAGGYDAVGAGAARGDMQGAGGYDAVGAGAARGDMQGAGGYDAVGSGAAQGGTPGAGGYDATGSRAAQDFTPGAGLGDAAVARASADGAPDRSGLQASTDATVRPGETSGDKAAPYSASDHVPFDARTATYDGKQMYDLSPEDKRTLPESTLNKVNENNVANLEQRVSDLGDKMPNMVFRGTSAQTAPEMDRLAAGQDPQYPEDRHFALSLKTAPDAAGRLSDMAANYRKAEGYAEQHNNNVYAFAGNSDMKAGDQRGYQKFAPEPFAQSRNAGESVISPGPNDLSHVDTLTPQDWRPPDWQVPMPQGATTSRFDKLSTYQSTQNLDRVMSKIEAPHEDYLRGVQAQRQAETDAQAQAQAQAESQKGVFSRLSESVKSWF